MRLSRRKPKGQLDLGFIASPKTIYCFPCAHDYLAKNMPAHTLGRDHKRSLVRQNPTPRWRKPRSIRPAIWDDTDYEEQCMAQEAEREAREEAALGARMAT